MRGCAARSWLLDRSFAVSAVPFDSSFPKETHREVFRIGAYGAPQCCPVLLRRLDGHRRHRRERPCENGNETERPDTSDKTHDESRRPGCPHGRRAEVRHAHARGQDGPLFEDIRFLGRLLGDVVREQEGDTVFDVVETIRQTAVKFRREDDSEAAQTLERSCAS